MFLLSEKQNKCPACTVGLGSSCHGHLHLSTKIWKIPVEASVVVPKFCSLHGCFQKIASPSWAPLPGTWATTRVDSTKQLTLWTFWGGRGLSKPTTHILFVCKGTLAPTDGQNLVNHPRCSSVCCHVAHGTHKTEPEGFGVFVLFCKHSMSEVQLVACCQWSHAASCKG